MSKYGKILLSVPVGAGRGAKGISIRQCSISVWAASLCEEFAVDTQVSYLQTHDFEELCVAARGWDQQYRQIGPGGFRGSIHQAQTRSFGVLRVQWGRAIHYRGTAPKGTFGLAISIAQPREARWLGHAATARDMVIQQPGSEADYYANSHWDCVAFAIPETMLARHVADISRDDPERVLQAHGVIRLQPERRSRLREASLAYLSTASRREPAPSELLRLSEMADSLVELVARSIVDDWVPPRAPRVLRRRKELIRRAEDFAMDRAGQPLRISELCRELGLSERTLRYTFQEYMGTAPLDYLKSKRLNRVYLALRNARPADVLIKSTAHAHGFRHLGQFARDYKKLFGESPSQTLERG